MSVVSVVVLSYNNFEGTTGPCLESLYADPACGKWKVVVVDNASDSTTREKLEEASRRFANCDIIFNDANLGFPGGMNVGLRNNQSAVTVLLNSDTRVLPGMIDALANALMSNPKLGIVAPVSNAAGNEQKIFCGADAPDAILREGGLYASAGGADLIPAYRLDFCGVAVSRQLLDRVGLLDEDFGRGYYEDFDYCIRARRAGFNPSVVESAFLYHQGGASFSKMSQQTKDLLAKNKKLLIRKHGADLRMPHVRDANLAVLTHYAGLKQQRQTIPAARINNRLSLAAAELPRGFFKRLRYRNKLNRLKRCLSQFAKV